MRYTTTDGPDEPLNAIQDGSLGDKMGIAGIFVFIYLDDHLFAGIYKCFYLYWAKISSIVSGFTRHANPSVRFNFYSI